MNKQVDKVGVNLSEIPFNRLPCIKQDDEGPVFNAPWEARAFGLAVQLNQSGVFEWSDWVEKFNQQIQIAQSQGDPDLGDTYYNHWLLTLEGILLDKKLVNLKEIESREESILDEIKHIQHSAT